MGGQRREEVDFSVRVPDPAATLVAMTDGLAHTKPPTASEVWFDTYLRLHGYTWKPEPDVGIAKRPDRLIERDGAIALCEVKQFDKDPIAWMRETG